MAEALARGSLVDVALRSRDDYYANGAQAPPLAAASARGRDSPVAEVRPSMNGTAPDTPVSARAGLAGTTPTPDIFYDVIAPTLDEGELRVMLYLIRRLHGFSKSDDAISLTQFCCGMARKDGSHLDRGTGMCRKAVAAALSKLEARDLVRIDRGSPKGRITSVYRLNLVAQSY